MASLCLLCSRKSNSDWSRHKIAAKRVFWRGVSLLGKMRLEFSWFSPEKEDWETWDHPASHRWLHSWERKSWTLPVPRKEAGDGSWVDLVQKV